MADKEKVIKGVESCIKMGRLGVDNCRELNCPYFENGHRLSCWIDVLADALELLKEQQQKIEVLEEQNGKLIRQKEARFQPVRCKDCFHKLEIDGKCYCDKPSENIIRFKDPNWYCADGIPKKET